MGYLRILSLLLALSALVGCEDGADTRLSRLTLELRSGTASEQTAAASALAEMGEGGWPAIPVLVALLDDEPGDEAVQEAVARALLSMGEPVVPTLSPVLRGEIPLARDRALRIIGELGPAAAAAVPDLLFLIRGANSEVREPARAVLMAQGEAAVPYLLAALKSKDWLERAPAVKCLAEIGLSRHEDLTALLTDPLDRRGAIDFLLLADTPPDLKLQDLLPVLTDPDPEVRKSAISVLLKLGSSGETTIEMLRPRLGDADADVIVTAIRTLSTRRVQRGGRYLVEVLVPELLLLLEHEEARVRSEAAGMLTWVVKEPSPETIEALIERVVPTALVDEAMMASLLEALSDRSDPPHARMFSILIGKLGDEGPRVDFLVPAVVGSLCAGELNAGSALRFLRGRRALAVPLLQKALPGADRRNRWALLKTLCTIDPSTLEDQELVSELTEILSDRYHPGGTLRLAALIASLTGAGSAVDSLVPLVVDAVGKLDFWERDLAEFLAGREKVAVPLLNQALTRADVETRLSLLYLLFTLEADEGKLLPAVRQALTADDAKRKIHGVFIAQLAGPVLKEVVPALAALLRDDDEEVFSAVTEALFAMGSVAESALPILREIAREHPEEWRRVQVSTVIGEIEGEN